jgi:hypothetical protein
LQDEEVVINDRIKKRIEVDGSEDESEASDESDGDDDSDSEQSKGRPEQETTKGNSDSEDVCSVLYS